MFLLVVTAFGFCFPAQSQQYVYTNNDIASANSTTALKVSKSGSMTVIDTYSTGGKGAGASSYWAMHPATSAITNSSQCLFVANGGDSTIAAFQINTSDGTLTTVHGSPFSYGVSGQQPSGVGLAEGNNQLLFVSNSKFKSISVLRINSNCTLKTGSTTSLSYSPVAMRVTNDNKYLVATLVGPVDSFMIDYTNAKIMELGPFKAKGQPMGIDISCDDSLVFFGDASTHTQVEVFGIATDGTLNQSQNFTDSKGSNSNNILLSANGKELYVTNNQSNQISVLSVESGGTLVFDRIVNLKKPGEYSSALSTNPAGTQLYVSEASNPWSIGVLGAKGTHLREIPGSPFPVVKNSFDPAGIVPVPKRTCK
jgi:6-phosphogluconolactonase (cycloisomerase 2 family)